MPLYDYVCTKCGHEMEVMHSVHGHGPSACPKCGSPMKKTFAPPAVHFKGTGWARKERSSSRPASTPKSETSSSGPEPGGGSSSPSAPKDGD